MEIPEIIASAAAIVALSSLPAFAAADRGMMDGELFDSGGLKPILSWSQGGSEAHVPPRTDLMNAGSSWPGQLSGREKYEGLVDETARACGLESALLHAVVHVESSYNAKAVSPQGAVGLMQLMPETARRYDVSDAFDPAQNLRGGALYLRDLVAMFGNDLRLALAAYNAGESAVIRNGNRVPPLKETLSYVARVLKLYRHNAGAEMRMR